MTKGGRNLLIMGVLSALIALVTTGVSLAIYHNSGDIYLDRSRPGFLPDNDEIKGDISEEDDYVYDKDADVTSEILEEYLEKLDSQIKEVDIYKDSFSEDGLSDKALGL